MDETARVQIAYAYETRDILESESKIAEHAYRKMVLVTRTYQLHSLNAQRKLLEFDKELSALVNAAALDLETFLGGEEHGDPAPVRTGQDARKLLIVLASKFSPSTGHTETQIHISQSSSHIF
jgi:hypothetical protein